MYQLTITGLFWSGLAVTVMKLDQRSDFTPVDHPTGEITNVDGLSALRASRAAYGSSYDTHEREAIWMD